MDSYGCCGSLCVRMLCCFSCPPGRLTGYLIPVASLTWPDGRLPWPSLAWPDGRLPLPEKISKTIRKQQHQISEKRTLLRLVKHMALATQIIKITTLPHCAPHARSVRFYTLQTSRILPRQTASRGPPGGFLGHIFGGGTTS